MIEAALEDGVVQMDDFQQKNAPVTGSLHDTIEIARRCLSEPRGGKLGGGRAISGADAIEVTLKLPASKPQTRYHAAPVGYRARRRPTMRLTRGDGLTPL